MAIRCYVGDAMVYRTIGDVDRALESVDPDDSARVLKTIEAFAVECSVNKVWTSEALAYVVDEAVQVFGGNGYSREFPVERAYRDARITRIYAKGTEWPSPGPHRARQSQSHVLSSTTWHKRQVCSA
jgi:alkylation response protein AidB-like acyl-CoA dehydrogenase